MRKNNIMSPIGVDSKMSRAVKNGFRVYCVLVMVLTIICMMSVSAFAEKATLVVIAPGSDNTGDPLTVVNNLSTFIFALIRAVGMILLGFGIVQVGLSLKSHDPSQRANGFLTVAGGIIITFAKEILDLITG